MWKRGLGWKEWEHNKFEIKDMDLGLCSILQIY